MDVERVKQPGRISHIIDRDLISRLAAESKTEISTVGLILVSSRREGDKLKEIPIVISHQNPKEIQDGVLHIESPDSKLIEITAKFFESVKK